MPATLAITAQPALAAPGTYYCDSYSANPIKVNDNGSGGYAVEQLTGLDSSPSSSSIHTLGISEINALGISPVDNKAYGIVPSGSNPNSLLVRFDDDEVRYVAEVEEKATQGTFDVHGDYINGDGSEIYLAKQPALPEDKARYVGEAVAMVVTETRDQAKDAAELVMVDYEPLKPVCDTVAAATADASVVWDELGGNVCIDGDVGDLPGTEAVLAGTHHVVRLATTVSRVTGVPMEPRAALGIHEEEAGRYTLHTLSLIHI